MKAADRCMAGHWAPSISNHSSSNKRAHACLTAMEIKTIATVSDIFFSRYCGDFATGSKSRTRYRCVRDNTFVSFRGNAMPARNQETNFHVAKPQFEICSKSGLATSIMKSHSSGFRVPAWTFSSPEPPWVGFSGLTPSFGNSGTQSFRNRHHRELLPPSKI
jgi:hypothetical protein